MDDIPEPTSITREANGGVVIRWWHGPTEDQIRIWADGRVELVRFSGFHVVARQELGRIPESE